MKIGVMTGGGDCAGLNAAIRGITRAAIIGHDYEVVGILDGFEGLIIGDFRPLQLSHVRGILRIGGTILGSSNRTNPFAYSASRTDVPVDASGRAYDTFQELNLDALVVIGGDGTLTLADRFASEYDIPIVGIPKTIDNDVHGTDYAIGFDTAVAVVTEAIDRLHTTAESHHRVMLVEVMGRTAGWIALYAGIAGGADFILIPEQGFTIEGIIERLESRRSVGHNFTIGSVAEGIPAPGGELVYRTTGGAEHSWKFGGVCQFLAATLSDHTDQEIRTITLGHLQRGGAPTAFDRALATQFASSAVEAVASGKSNILVGLKGQTVEWVPLSSAASGPRQLPAGHQLIQAAQQMGIYLG